jgi:tetratricopeptide (TPR) repeat protein
MANNNVCFDGYFANRFFTSYYSMHTKIFSLLLLIGISAVLHAQTEHTALLQGNQAYQDGNFRSAISLFQQAITKNENSLKGHYNLGNALYKNKQYAAAVEHFQEAVEQAESDQQKANALYNLGNSYLAQAQAQQAPSKESKTQLESAISAYKAALRNNPKDFEAKNNLATAYKLLRKQQPPQEQQQQNQQNQQQNQEENQEENQDSENNNSQNQEQEGNQEQQNPPNPQQQEQPIDNTNDPQPKDMNPKEMSKEEAKRLLQVIAEDDKDIQERLLQRQQRRPQKGDKTW